MKGGLQLQGRSPELWSALTNRKGVILAILLISLITAGFFIFFSPPVYESRAVLQIGQIGLGQRQIESPAVLTKRVMVQDDMDRGKTAIGKVRPFIHTAFLEKDTNLISIVARGPTPDATQEYLAHVVARVIHEHHKLCDLVRKEQQQSMDLIQKLGHDLNQAIAANEKRSNFVSERSKLLEQRTLVEQRQMD